MNNIMPKIINWVRTHKNAAITIAFIAVLAIGLGIAMASQLKEARTKAWEQLAIGQYLAMNGKTGEAHDVLRSLASGSRADVADFAAVYNASVHAREGNWQAAAESFKQVMDGNRAPKLQAIAGIGYAKMLEALGRFDEAQAGYTANLDRYPDHFTAPEAYEGLARIYSMKGQGDLATQNLERLKVLYPETGWGKRAEARLKGTATNKQVQ